ncbi:MAG: glucosamine-6-phosphate deaminase, partial [Candidatus Diapherotrites archaeon]|nr:glucosamine-6-phosphate deaminase [Candidatus Diapherotrites archaeon]
MEFSVCRTPIQVSDAAFEIVVAQLRKKPSSVLLLSSGSTPLGLYKRLVAAHRDQDLDFSKAVLIGLDEYLGLDAHYESSFHYFFNHELLSRVNVSRKNVFLFNPHTTDPKKECEKMAVILRHHRPDLAILGIGRNGHIAFNEPGGALNSKCRVVDVSHATRLDNARFFGSLDAVPRQAMTLGIFDILYAHRVLLMATGAEKAHAVHAALDESVSVNCPASALQRHDDTVVLCDAWAASKTRYPPAGPVLGGIEIANVFSLPRGKRVVFLSSRLSDVSLSAGALAQSLARKNTVVSVVAEHAQSFERSVIESQAKSQARMLGFKCLFVRSKAASKKDLLGDEKKWRYLLSTLSPDIVVVPNRFSTDSTDRWVRKVGLAYATTKKRCAVWSFETDRGLFEAKACDLVFEFGTDMLLSKIVAVRRLSHLRHLRLDVSAKSLAVFRKLA